MGTGPWPSRGFGGRVALSGDTALIGAGNFDSGGGVTSGAVFVYTRSAGAWAPEETIVPPDGAAGDRFGQAVAIEGNLAVIGAPEKDEAINNRGVTYLYSRVGSSWKLEPSLVPSGDPTALRRFGKSVALSGQTIVDGAPGYAQYEETVRVFVPKPRVGVSYCTCSVAHCGNPDPRAGCANSSGSGAVLNAQGIPANGDVDLLVENAIPGQFALFFEADNAIHAPFGDGFLCTYGNLIRFTKIPVQIDWDGTAEFGPCFGRPTIPELTGVVPGSGVTKRYQFWYRDPTGPCGTGSNATNALSISW